MSLIAICSTTRRARSGSVAHRTAVLFAIALSVLGCARGEPQEANAQSAFERQVGEIAKLLRYDGEVQVAQITVNGATVDSAILSRTTWELKNPGQMSDLNLQTEHSTMKLPEAERLKTMNRTDDHIQVWAGDPAVLTGATGKANLSPDEAPHTDHRELFYLGKARGIAWFGYMPIYNFVDVEKKMSWSGDPILPALIRGVAIDGPHECTRNSCEQRLGMEGARALEAIDEAIAARVPQRERLVMSMLIAVDPAVTRWLVRLLESGDAEVANAARWTLLNSPRKEAADIYVRWLVESAGKTDVDYVLPACRKAGATPPRDVLVQIIASPGGVYEYRQAVEFRRELDGKPAMPAELVAAEKAIRKHGYRSGPAFDQGQVDRAVETILAAKAPDEAAAIGMFLAVDVAKGNAHAIHRAGIRILQQLPGGAGKRLARVIAQNNRVEWQADQVQTVARELGCL